MKPLKEFKQQCLNEKYPIMSNQSLDFILSKMTTGYSLLELGSCVGYSAIYLASQCEGFIISLERDLERHLLARENVRIYQLEHRIQMIYDDALVYNPTRNFDVIIFDAAKAQNEVFFDRYFQYLKPQGFLFIDNMDFHGYVQNRSQIRNRNLRKMVQAIGDFEKKITNRNDLIVEHFPIGDGLLMITRV